MFTAARGGFNYYTSSANDPYWTSVSLLNNWENPQTALTDSSTNNFALTLRGTSTTPIRPNLRTPFANASGASMYWDGTASWIEMPANAAWNLGTGNFTFEAWVYVTNFSVNFGGYMPIMGWGGGSWKIFRVRPTAMNFQTPVPSNLDYNANWPSTMVINTWYHIALVRTSTTSVTAYLNGVAGTPLTISASASFGNATDVLEVGYKSDPGYWWGYMSNWRLVKGTAVYTGNFTPSTSPLTAISGTSGLLNFTNQGQQNSNNVVDQGPNAFAVTASGTGLKSTGLSPFGNKYPGSIYTQTGANLYATVATNAAFTYGTGDFTIECWIKLGAINATQYIIDQRNSGTATAIIPTLYVNSSNQLVYFVNGSARITGATTLGTTSWYHVAVARTSTSTKMFLNGVQEGSTYSDSSNYAASRVSIGTNGSSNGTATFEGYISNVRLSKGFCYYTTTFTPSTTPLTSSTTYTSLLTFTGTMALYDLSTFGSQMNQTGTAITQTVRYKFGTSSGQYSGSNFNYYSDDPQLQFGTGAFTIEGWVYRNASGAAHGLICKGAASTGWALTINSSNQLVWTTTTTAQKTSTTTIASATWTYFAITRTGSTNYMFINGTQEGVTWSDSTNFNQTNPLYLGNDRSASTSGLNGYLDDIRITKGVCRYTATFSAPTSAFPTS